MYICRLGYRLIFDRSDPGSICNCRNIYAVCSLKNEAFLMFRNAPQMFVRLIGMRLLSLPFTATRIKGEVYHMEEETRFIISSQVPVIADFVKSNQEIIQNTLYLDSDKLIRVLLAKPSRLRAGKIVFL